MQTQRHCSPHQLTYAGLTIDLDERSIQNLIISITQDHETLKKLQTDEMKLK